MRWIATDDDALLTAAAEGDQRAFEVFYRRWLAMITGFICVAPGRVSWRLI